MTVNYIAQPNAQVGRVVFDLLQSDPSPDLVVFVSAFAAFQSIRRLKPSVADIADRGADVKFVLGIDLGGTSREVLAELLTWNVQTFIVKHRFPGHTFHPKLYLFQWRDRAVVIIGSNNLTEGGFYSNYEGAAQVTYDLPADRAMLDAAYAELARFVSPTGPVSYRLTPDLLLDLVKRGGLPTEEEARIGRDISRTAGRSRRSSAGSPFGTETFEPPPALPADLLDGLVRNVRARRVRNRTAPAGTPPVDTDSEDSLAPTAFYMTLPTLQGPNIPGEGRIPLDAIDLAKDFWGWPDEYTRDVSPRAGERRVYWNWRPSWRVWSVQKPDEVRIQVVRMYMYENSSDFRFYVRPLVDAGGDLGDVVRIRRIAHPEAEYECVLARNGTKEYSQWIAYCTQPVRNSTRFFGYA